MSRAAPIIPREGKIREFPARFLAARPRQKKTSWLSGSEASGASRSAQRSPFLSSPNLPSTHGEQNMEPKCNHVFQKHKHDPDPQVCDEPFSGIENPKAPRIVACALANGAIALPVCFMQQLRRSAERRPSRRQMVQKAAEQGHGEAQFKLGALREEG